MEMPTEVAEIVNVTQQKRSRLEKTEFLVMCAKLVTKVIEVEEIWERQDPIRKLHIDSGRKEERNGSCSGRNASEKLKRIIYEGREKV